MQWFVDVRGRRVRLTDERLDHIETDHPEMNGQIGRMEETLANPDMIVRSKTAFDVELFYRHYPRTPVTEKFLCVVLKVLPDDVFVITSYFTDRVKRGDVLWEKK